MARVSRLVMNERKARMLGFLFEQGAAAEGVSSVSYRTLGHTFDISAIQARNVMHLLQDDGLVEVHNRYLPNGTQLENLYRITPKGVEVLRTLAQYVEEASSCPA